MRNWILQATVALAVLGGQSAFGGQVLNDWCVNIDGNVVLACNGYGGGSTGGGAAINLANMDLTLSPDGTNTLGHITATFTSGSNHYVSFYADYDVNAAEGGSLNDSISMHGVVASDLTYEAADPSAGGLQLYYDFAGSSLTNMNSVGTPDPAPATRCCDGAFALAVSGINGTGTIDFTVSTTAPVSVQDSIGGAPAVNIERSARYRPERYR